jgi:hypothetical protein
MNGVPRPMARPLPSVGRELFGLNRHRFAVKPQYPENWGQDCG